VAWRLLVWRGRLVSRAPWPGAPRPGAPRPGARWQGDLGSWDFGPGTTEPRRSRDRARG